MREVSNDVAHKELPVIDGILVSDGIHDTRLRICQTRWQLRRVKVTYNRGQVQGEWRTFFDLDMTSVASTEFRKFGTKCLT